MTYMNILIILHNNHYDYTKYEIKSKSKLKPWLQSITNTKHHAYITSKRITYLILFNI